MRHCETADDLLNPVWAQVLAAWAHAVWLTTAQIEFRHARQKVLVPKKKRFVACVCGPKLQC
jgi:hypothetical protein